MTGTHLPFAPSAPPTRQPVSWTALPDLFLKPTRFFQSVELDQGWVWLIATLLMGITSAIGRIEQNIMRAEVGHPRPGWETFGPWVMGSWSAYWLVVVLAGSLGAVFLWYLGGWWYNVRLRWSGAGEFDKEEGRLIYVFSGLVQSIPNLVYAGIATAVFVDFQAAWDSEEIWSALLLPFPFWAILVSYRGVRARFAVRPAPARVWFLILPMLAYAVALGVFATLYALLTSPDAGTVSV